jgi:hypothetical protein
MVMTKEEARAASARMHAAMTPEQRKRRARKAHLASAVASIVRRIGELDEDQLTRLRDALGGVRT